MILLSNRLNQINDSVAHLCYVLYSSETTNYPVAQSLMELKLLQLMLKDFMPDLSMVGQKGKIYLAKYQWQLHALLL